MEKDFMDDYNKIKLEVIKGYSDKVDLLRDIAREVMKYEPIIAEISPKDNGLLLKTALILLQRAVEITDAQIKAVNDLQPSPSPPPTIQAEIPILESETSK